MKIHRASCAALAAGLSLLLSAAAQAAPHGILWARGRRPLRLFSASSGNLLYYGGPVISRVKVTAVFWTNQVNRETQARIGSFFSNILDSSYMDWLSEYDTDLRAVDGRAGTGQKIGRGSYAGSVTIQPRNASRDLTDAMLQKELAAQIAAGRLPPPDANTLYMLYFPPNSHIPIGQEASCEAFCAYHEGFKTASGASVFYGVMPDCGSWSCGEGSRFNNLSSVSSHEAMEAVTDPFPTPGSNPAYPQAWNTSDGEEVADLCVGGDSTVTGHGLTSVVQQLWDNRTHSCLKGPWAQRAATPLLGPLAAGLLR
ncbi:MAG: hypothetical protein KGK30_09495, partial [Elusimicrobia bacterium]|nr:hypothetical protein [Elusimicrobiota bacterium]